MKRIYLVIAAAIIASSVNVNAQDAERAERRAQGNPLFATLDANKDGTIDAQEITGASAALRKLDKDGDGKVTRQEIRPAGAAKPGQPGAQPKADRPRKRDKNAKAN